MDRARDELDQRLALLEYEQVRRHGVRTEGQVNQNGAPLADLDREIAALQRMKLSSSNS